MMKPRRKSTIDRTISSPGAVRINFQGAFIVDEELSTPSASADDVGPIHHNHATQGIRLPNHQAVVSHVALDASASIPSRLILPWMVCFVCRDSISPERELMRVAANTDRRVIGQTGLLLAGAELDAHRRPVELCQIRDG